MKPYKRLCFVVLAFVLLAALSGCIMIPVSKYYDIPEEEVASIQLYDLRSEETIRSYNFEKNYEPSYTLPEKDIEAFLEDFTKLKFSRIILIVPASVDPGFDYGVWVVRINYTDGRYAFYSCGGYSETMDAEGNCISSNHYGCEEEDLERLIGKYYPLQP